MHMTVKQIREQLKTLKAELPQVRASKADHEKALATAVKAAKKAQAVSKPKAKAKAKKPAATNTRGVLHVASGTVYPSARRARLDGGMITRGQTQMLRNALKAAKPGETVQVAGQDWQKA